MIKIYGYNTFNSNKVLYVAEHSKLDFEFKYIDLAKGENKTEEYMKIHPVGKVPSMTHNGNHLFESGAICRYLGALTNSSFYPSDLYSKAITDQWMDYFSCHLGRWFGTIFFQKIIKPMAYQKEADPDALKEAFNFINTQIVAVDQNLAKNKYLSGNDITIADYFCFSYIETIEHTKVDINDWKNVSRWYKEIKSRDEVKAVHEKYLK